MEIAKILKKKQKNEYKKKPNDIYYTPKPIAIRMIELCGDLTDKTVLDPCRGKGIFFDNFPEDCKKEYCEITEGKDFFNFNEKVDWIIGNPPYSLWDKWLEHSIKLTDNICYIMGNLNLTDTRVKKLKELGYGITKLEIVKVNWWFGHHFILIIQKNKDSIISGFDKRVYCDICNNNCLRGTGGRNPNECCPKNI